MIDRIGRDVARELSRFGAGDVLARIVDAWPSAVGPQIARNAWPARVARDGTLLVHVSSSAWAFELAQLEAQVRSSLGVSAPQRLRFAVGPLPEQAPEPRSPRSEAALSPSREQLERGTRLAESIADEDLREVVAKTAALGLARAASDRRFC